MWIMTSKGFKIRNDNDKNAYIANLGKFQKEGFRFTLKRAAIVRGKATVTLEKCVTFSRKVSWECETSDEPWIFEAGKWFFDQ